MENFEKPPNLNPEQENKEMPSQLDIANKRAEEIRKKEQEMPSQLDVANKRAEEILQKEKTARQKNKEREEGPASADSAPIDKAASAKETATAGKKEKPIEKPEKQKQEKKSKKEVESKKSEQQEAPEQPEKEERKEQPEKEAWREKIEGIGPSFYDKNIKIEAELKYSTLRDIEKGLRKEQDRLKMDFAKKWFNDNYPELKQKDSSVRRVDVERLDEQSYVWEKFIQYGGFEEFKKSNEYKKTENLGLLIKEVRRGTTSPETRALALNALNKRAEAIKDRIESGNATWFERRVLKEEQKELFNTRKEIAERIRGKKALKREVREEKGIIRAMRKGAWEDSINTLEGNKELIEQYYEQLRNKAREEYEKEDQKAKKKEEQDYGTKTETKKETKAESKEVRANLQELLTRAKEEMEKILSEKQKKQEQISDEEESFWKILAEFLEKLIELEKRR